MESKKIVVAVPNEVRDLIQRIALEYHQKRRVISGLIEDHQFDTDPADFLNSKIFLEYENKMSKAMYAFDEATTEMANQYCPEEFKGKNFKWDLNYKTCEITYVLV